MCGIYGILDHGLSVPDARQTAVQQARLLRHRGPDRSGLWVDDIVVLAHERLSIVDPASGAQPLVSRDSARVLAVNGEIYDHVATRRAFPDYDFLTGSDCEVILPLYAKYGSDCVHHLRGMFAFVLYDATTGEWLIARDHMGIIPLYLGWDARGALHVASEMKALTAVCERVQVFAPGHVMTRGDAQPRRWYTRDWMDAKTEGAGDPDALRAAMIESVTAHLMSDVPYGVLLSGGLDSSVVSAIAAKASTGPLHSFSVGLEGSPDLAAAKVVAEHIGTVHHSFEYTVQEGFDALSDVIYHLETFDVTTIRASTPMYLMARRIKALGIKMVLSGEGADEIFAGYLYFHKAPDAEELHAETVRKLAGLHAYDCLRANKSMAAWGIEARVPFLDRDFMDHAMRVPAQAKMCGHRIEKHLLREAFQGWLPESVLWRQKEQFSDGVGYGWIDGLKAHAEAQVSDRALADAATRFPVGTPTTKEGYFYRTLFERHFPTASQAATVPVEKSVACSTGAAIAWDAAFADAADPSGRAVKGVHVAAYG